MFKRLDSLLQAKSIAIVGASERARWPNVIYANLRDGGYSGKIYPVNPRYGELWGMPCYPGLDALPEAAEHALVVVPAARVLDVIEAGVKSGLKSATVYAAGIGDGKMPEAHVRGRRLKQICEETGLVVGGPNCMGAVSWREKLFLYPNENLPKFGPGPVGVVFQSGGTLQFWVQTAGERGLRFSYAVTSGNELNVDLSDYVNFLVDDPETKIIALFLEGIRKPDAFRAVAARALEEGKPIVVIKTGRTELSREAAESHTSAIGGDWAAFEAMCERYGIVVCPTLDDLIETLLAFQQPRLPKGPRIGFVTTSGGTVDLLFDYAEDTGAVMPPFSAATIERIEPEIAEEITIKNPLDSGIPRDIETLAMFCEAVLDDPEIDMLAFAARPERFSAGDEGPITDLMSRSDKPMLAFERMRYPMDAKGVETQDRLGAPFLQGLPETLRALNALHFYAERTGKAPRTPPEPTGSAANLEGAAFERLLNANGVNLPRSAFVGSAEDAAKAAAEIGFPVALKIVAPAFSHKTEIGGVLLGIQTAEQVAEGVATLASRLRAADAQAEIDGFLVQEMASGVEIIAGCREDPIYGPVVLVGAGGVLVELVRDASMRLLPVGEDDVHAMIGELKAADILAGFRGSEAADVSALVRAVVGLGDIFLDHRHLLADLEVNPLIVRPEGQGVAAVDVRPVRR